MSNNKDVLLRYTVANKMASTTTQGPSGKSIAEINSTSFDSEIPKGKEEYNGIRIYPLRIGVYRDGFSESQMKVFTGPKVPDSHKKIKLIDNDYPMIHHLKDNPYHYYMMPLRKGWLYVFSKLANGIYEFEFSGTKFKKTNFYFKELKKDFWQIDVGYGPFLSCSDQDEVGFFYSEVKLTHKAVIENFLEGKSPMQIAPCAQWSKTNGDGYTIKDNIISLSQTVTYFPLVGEPEYDTKCINRYSECLKKGISNNENKQKKIDMVILIRDPMGIAGQLRYDLRKAHCEQEVFLRSLRTGVNPDLISSRLLSYTPKSNDKEIKPITDEELLSEYKDKIAQHASIHTLALILNNLLFKNPPKNEEIEKALRAADKNKIHKILGVEGRENNRKKIQNQRNILNLFIKSGLFQTYCNYFNIPTEPKGNDRTADKMKKEYYEMINESKKIIHASYYDLSILPDAMDRYIEGKKYDTNGNEVIFDPCEDTFSSVLKEKNNSGKLLSKDIDLLYIASDYNENTNSSLSTEDYLKLMNNVWVSFGRTIMNTVNTTTIEIKLFKCTKIGDRRLFEVEYADFRKIMREKQREIFEFSEKTRNKLKVTEPASNGRIRFLENENLKGYDKLKNEITIKTRYMIDEEGNKFLATKNKVGKFALYVTRHPAYISVMSLHYMWILKKMANEEMSLKNKAVGMGHLAVGVLSLRTLAVEGLLIRSGEKATIIQGGLIKYTNQFNKIAGYGFILDVVDSLREAIALRGKDDFDAMACYSIAASISFFGAILAFGSNTAWAGWVGIAIAVVGVGIKLLADHLKNGKIEAFILNTIFSKKYDYAFNDNTPLYIHINNLAEIYANKQGKGEYYKSDYRYQLEEFMMTVLLVPYFKINFSYLTNGLIYRAGYRPISSDFVQGVYCSFLFDWSDYNANITDMEMYPFYVNRLGWVELNNDDTKKVANNLQKVINIDTPKRGELFSYVFSRFDKKEEIQHFIYGTRACIVTYIRFKVASGMIPYARVSKETKKEETTYLVYIHSLEHEKGNYEKVKISLKEVFIDSLSEAKKRIDKII